MSDYPSMVHVQHIVFDGCDCVVMSPEEYGAALADLEAKDAEIDRLRAENARQRAWIDGVMAQRACYASQRAIEWMSGNALRTTEVGAQTSTRTIPLITRPAPFEDK